MTHTITLNNDDICHAIEAYVKAQGYKTTGKPFLQSDKEDRPGGSMIYFATIQVEKDER